MEIEIRHSTGWRAIHEAALNRTLSPLVFRLYLRPGELDDTVVFNGTQVEVRVDGVDALAASELRELRSASMAVLVVVMPCSRPSPHA